MQTFTNDFKAMADADPELIQRAQREVVTAAVSRQMFCPISGVVLNQKSTVVVIPSVGRMVVLAADVWAAKQDEVTAALAANPDVTLEVYDGRELW